MFRILKLLTAVAVVAGAATPAVASPILGVESAIVHAPDTTGTVNVYLTVPLGDAAINLGGFDFTLSVSGAAQFAAVDYPGSNYVFPAANSFNLTNSQSLSSDVFPNTTFYATDLALTYETINPGQTVLLGTVSFSVPPYVGATVVYDLTVTGGPLGLVDENGDPIAFTTANGTITQVPEPSAIVVFGALAAAGFGVRRRKLAKAWSNARHEVPAAAPGCSRGGYVQAVRGMFGNTAACGRARTPPVLLGSGSTGGLVGINRRGTPVP